MSVRTVLLGFTALASALPAAWGQTTVLELRGETMADGFGWSLSSAGDVDGDGFQDVVVGAPSHASVQGYAGRAYLFRGPFLGPRLAAQAGAIVSATTFGDNLGIAVSSAGDVNSDGFDDLLLGARGNDGAGIQAGRCYVFHGPLSGALNDTQADATFSGLAFDEVGHEVAGGGDLNGDGVADIVLGAPLANVPAVSTGAAYVFYGPVSGSHSVTGADATLTGSGTFNEMLGASLAFGDLNNDGQDDLITGAPRPPLNGQGNGRVYVLFGPVSGAHNAANADVIIDGQAINDEFGSSVSVGDVNGDSLPDLIVGADQFFTANTGKAYVFYGPFGAGTMSFAQAGAVLLGEAAGDAFGTSVASGTDFDRDGFDDVLVGADSFGENQLNGRAYLFRGPLNGTIAAANADRIFTGAVGDLLGHAVAMAAGLTPTGRDALMLAAPAHPSFPSPGIVRVVQPLDVFDGFCSGDGSAAACPCGNAGAAGRGCANSVDPAGAHESASGTASLTADTFVLHGSGMPESSALYFQGTSEVNGGMGVVFGDGLRCAGGNIIRLGLKFNTGGSSQYPEPGDASVSVKGLVTAPGTRTYQIWYRNAAAFCQAATFNLTNGVRVTWGQ